MKNVIVGMLAETFIHAGAGSNKGAIDLPAAREAGSGYPFIPGSGIKGALRELAKQWWQDDEVQKCFGYETTAAGGGAGGVLVGDARLLLLPVRSLTGSYKWVTCPHLLERLYRDRQRAGFADNSAPGLDKLEDGNLLGSGSGQIFLEERTFEFQGPLPEELCTLLKSNIYNQQTKNRLAEQVVVVNNKVFSWFANFALSIQARNVLLEKTKESTNLWYEESLPPDTLMYCLLAERISDSSLSNLKKLLEEKKYFQAGGNETVGQGWFGVTVIDPEIEESNNEH